ncbi:MAG TPA: 3-oxoadipate enol-lactonase [Acidimicrobiales bacterium]|nr:3-oxoadipate enol-lactonase [Acidimicrobiales bacterium]
MTDRKIRVDGPSGAPVLVLSNSLGTTSDMWQPQMEELSARFRVVRYEHRGHGGTDGPPGPYTLDDIGGDLLAVLDEVGADKASLMGLSLGATTALWVAAHHPERVDRLVLACGDSHWPPSDAWYTRIEKVRTDGPASLLDVLVDRWFTPQFVTDHPDVRPVVAAMLQTAGSDGYAGCCAALAEVDLRPRLGSVTAPTLVLAGNADPAMSVGRAAELATAVPGASLQVISPGAHLLNMEQPDRFTAAALDHLAGLPVQRGRATRRAVLGDAHVDRSERAASPLTAPFSDLITRYAWGDIWTRPGLDRRTRSCITLAMLVSLGRFDELELHLRAARRNGLSDPEIGEVLLQTAIYCGVPAANSAFAVARRVLESPDGG